MTAHDLNLGARPEPTLAQRIETAKSKASIPGDETYVDPPALDVEAWNHVGDPLCEALVTEMRERKMMGGNLYQQARALQRLGSDAADAFFADVEHVPNWADFEAMRLGAEMAKRNPLGMMLGIHGSLPFTYVDPATARVMGSTGRLARQDDADFGRRYWETATGFIGALDVDGMRPHGEKWQQWVRIRFLHTMIRLGILRSGRWNTSESAPISAAATGSGAHIFGRYRVNIIRALGGYVTQAETDSFDLMWRWIARIEGVHCEMLGRTPQEQFALAQQIHAFFYAPNIESRAITAAVLDGLDHMPIFPLSRRGHAAVLRRVMSEQYIETYPGRDVPGDLGVAPDLAADLALTGAVAVMWGANQAMRLPLIRRQASSLGYRFINSVVTRNLAGRAAEFHATPVAGDTGISA